MAEREPVTGDVLGGRYEIQSELGRGGMATVYRGRDLRLHRRVAVKVFRDGFAESVDPQRRTQEMQLLASVNHPSVVAVLDASTGDGVFGAYLVMELVSGDDLGALLHRARGALSADFARRIVADVASALQALHVRGVVHRDVKPANILVPSTAVSPSAAVAAKLTDFGIAQLVDGAAVTSPETILGTAAYLSPEQVRGAPPRPASDVYSLGLVLLEALTGERAFPGPAAEAAMARLHRPPPLPPGASPALADLLSRMTALDPGHRPSAGDVTVALREQLAGGVLAPDATQTALTPISGVPAPHPAVPPSHGADQTAPHAALWTPSRGMPIATGGIRTTGAVRTASGGTTGPLAPGRRASRRFPAVLAITASALAAVVAAVAMSAAAGTGAPPASAGVESHPAVAAPAPAATDQHAVEDTRRDLTSTKRHAASRSPKPTPSASTPPPSSSAPTPTATPTTAVPSTSVPVPLPAPVAPSAAPPESSAPTAQTPIAPPSAPPSSSESPSSAPSAVEPVAPPASSAPSSGSGDGDDQQMVVGPEAPADGSGTTT